MIDIGRAIRIVRGAKGMRAGTLAKSSKISTPFLSLIEQGKRGPSLDVLRRIAHSLGVPSEVLILLSQPSYSRLKSSSIRTQVLLAAIRKLLTVEDELRVKLGRPSRKKAAEPGD